MCSDYNCNDNYATCLFLHKLYRVDKMILRALGLSLQQLPWLPFGALGPGELSWHHVKHHWFPWLSHHSLSWSSWCSEQTCGRGSQDWGCGWRAPRERCPGLAPQTQKGPGRGTKSLRTCQRLKGIYLPAFPIACFLSGENPFWQPRRWASNSCLRLIFHFNPSANGF